MAFAATVLHPRVVLVQDLPDLVDAGDQPIASELQFHLREEDPLTTFQQEQMELQPLVGREPAVGRRIAEAAKE